jgi:hypothetical protein
MLHKGDDPRQKCANRQPKYNAQRKRMNFASKDADQYARDQSLNIDPKTMPTIPARTAGVNHAVSPSRMPKTAPSNRPSTILLLIFAAP